MREIRTSGSEGGAGREPRSYLYPFEARDAGGSRDEAGVRDPAAASSAREGLQRGDPAGGIGGRDREACDESCDEVLIRDAFA